MSKRERYLEYWRASRGFWECELSAPDVNESHKYARAHIGKCDRFISDMEAA